MIETDEAEFIIEVSAADTIIECLDEISPFLITKAGDEIFTLPAVNSQQLLSALEKGKK